MKKRITPIPVAAPKLKTDTIASGNLPNADEVNQTVAQLTGKSIEVKPPPVAEPAPALVETVNSAAEPTHIYITTNEVVPAPNPPVPYYAPPAEQPVPVVQNQATKAAKSTPSVSAPKTTPRAASAPTVVQQVVQQSTQQIVQQPNPQQNQQPVQQFVPQPTQPPVQQVVYPTVQQPTVILKTFGRPPKPEAVGRDKFTTRIKTDLIVELKTRAAKRKITVADLLEMILNDNYERY